jgi:hypothetical protein
MAHLNNDLPDDPLAFDGTQSFEGGSVLLMKPNLLATNQCVELENMDIDRSGRLLSRKGTVALGESPDSESVKGLFFYDWDTEFLVRIANGEMQTWDGSDWAAVAGFESTEGYPVEMCQLVDTLFATNGVEIYQWDGDGDAAVIADSPACRFMVTHVGRVFIAGLTDPDEVRYSNTLAGEAGYASSIIVGGGDGEGVTGLCPWQNFLLLVFKRNSIYAANTDPQVDPSEWSAETVSRKVGCVAHRSIQQIGNDVFFLSDDGVRSIGRTLNERQIGISDPLSDPIRSIIERINWEFADSACSAFYKNRYLLAVPLDSATSPNYVLVYNVLTRSWSGYWSGWNPTVFAETRFSGIKKVVFGQEDGSVMEWLDWKSEDASSEDDYTDNGTVYPTMMLSRGHHFEDQIGPKSGYHYELEFYRSDSEVEVSVILDRNTESSSYTGDTRKTPLVLPLDLPFQLPAIGSFRVSRDLQQYGQFHSIQFRVRSESGKLSVQAINLAGFRDTINEEAN